MSFAAMAIRLALACCLGGLFGASAAAADDSKPAAAAPATPVEDFANEYKLFKEQLSALPKKIEDTSREVEGKTAAASTHDQLNALRAIVSSALAQVADNGSVARLGQSALGYTRQKLTDLSQDSHYTKDQRAYLIKEWTTTAQLTSGAVDELEASRKELADLLKVLQSNDDFMRELEALNNAAKVVEVIRDLTSGLREISGHLKVILQRMNGPNM